MASCLPLSRLELIAPGLLPRRSAPIVVCDDGGLAERAAARLIEGGYTDVSVLEGGVAAWEAAGFPVYSGVHVPSKAFAEVVEHECGTPWISAEELAERQKARRADGDLRQPVLRGIPLEHDPRRDQRARRRARLSLPRAGAVTDTFVVVNCGGRTRSIIGAQSLIDAGVPNRVVSLKDGTMAWHLAGGSGSLPARLAVTGPWPPDLRCLLRHRPQAGRLHLEELPSCLTSLPDAEQLLDDLDRLEHPVDPLRRLRPVPADDVLVERLARPSPSQMPTRIHRRQRRRGLGDDAGMGAEGRGR